MSEKVKSAIIGLLSLLTVALLFVVLNMQMKLSETQKALVAANDEIKRTTEYNGKMIIGLLNQSEPRLKTLRTNGVWWTAGCDQSNVWISINATNEPVWKNETNGGTVLMKKLPGFNPPDELQ